jgi:hypothetical protein
VFVEELMNFGRGGSVHDDLVRRWRWPAGRRGDAGRWGSAAKDCVIEVR